MTRFYPCFIILLVFVISSVFSESSSKAESCSKRDRCSSKSFPKTCSCDEDCHSYGTCCHDVSKHDQTPPAFRCYNRRTTNAVLAKRSCSEDFRGHVGTKAACLEEDEDEMDVKNNLLVTSRVTKVTYWNKQCAACNLEDASDLDFWNIVVLCPSHENIDKYLIRRNLTFDQDNLRWGLLIGEDFLQCFVQYTPPYYAEEVKRCTPDVISSCPDGYDNEDISTKCSQYYAERQLKNSDTYYKNVHCAICNGVDKKELDCPGMANLDDNVEESDFRDMVEETFTNGEWLHKEPDKTFECSRGYVYDPFRERCRTYEIKEVMVISNTAHELRIGYLTLLTPIVALLYKMVVFEYAYASQQNVR